MNMKKNSKNQIKLDEKSKKLIVNATQSWQKWQVQELGRAKKVKPNAMKIKHV